MIRLYEFLLLVCFVLKPSRGYQIKDCFPIRGDANSITCRTIPKCQEANTLNIFSQYTRIVFDLENTFSIDQTNFFNCSFSWSNQINLDFKNIRLVNKYAFEQIKVEKNVRLNIRFDGSGLNLAKTGSLNTQNFLIRKDAFKNVELSKNAQLSIEVVILKN